MTHYMVGSEATDSKVEHIHANNQEEAVKKFVTGDNDGGFLAKEFDGYDIYVVAASKVSEFTVEITPPTTEQVKIVKVPARPTTAT